MTFTLFGIDVFVKERLFGLWIASIKTEAVHRSLFTVYFDSLSIFIDVLFVRVITINVK